MHLKKANVRWFLSLDSKDIPSSLKEKEIKTYRSLKVENEEIEFSDGFTDLHTESYRQLLAGNGFGIKETRSSVEIAHTIRNSTPVGIKGDYHPLLKTIRR